MIAIPIGGREFIDKKLLDTPDRTVHEFDRRRCAPEARHRSPDAKLERLRRRPNVSAGA